MKTFVSVSIFAVLSLLLLSGCDAHSAKQGGGQLYTCPMHPQIIRNAPGDCPICSMRLVPVRNSAKTQGSNSAPAPKSNTGTNATSGKYTCPMDPEIVRDAPDKCPICGMRLVPLQNQNAQTNQPASMSSAGAESHSTEMHNAEALTIDAVMTQNMNLRTGKVARGTLHRTLRTVGIVEYDETALADVTTKFRGWIEKLYVDATGKQMHKGEPMFEIYSPDLYLAQTEYLLTLGSSGGAPVSSPAETNSHFGAHESSPAMLRREASLTKLKYWDISDDQIKELEQTRTPKKTLRVNAPRDGIVLEKMAVQGQMVEPGMKLYRLADLGTVWVIAQVYEQDLAAVQLGQEAVVSLSAQPEPKFRGRVTYIYPSIDERTRTARVRMEFHNPGYFLKPGMYATVELQQQSKGEALLVPAAAVLRSGENDTVFVVIDPGHFEPRSIKIGARNNADQYEVLSGLKDGETVVTSGQFMLDSESQLREAIQKFSSGNQPAVASSPSEATNASSKVENPQAKSSADSMNVVYLCPMPEHVALQYSHPGKCPLCGMALVPVTPELLAKIRPGGQVEYYTCPMPEHKDVHESKPGKCPRCSMTLIPVMKP
jgi:rubrerythrin